MSVLEDDGFEVEYAPEDDPSGTSRHATALFRTRDGSFVDLHVNLPDVRAHDALAWKVLSASTVFIRSGGSEVEALGDERLALVIALHAAHHGPVRSHALDDLTRAVAAFPDPVWVSARDLAMELGSVDELAAGLSLVEGGAALNQRLGLSVEHSRARELRWSRAPWGASVLEDLARGDRSFAERMLVGLRFVFPSPRAMRLGSGLARRGTLGMAVAYAIRPIRVLWRLPAVLTATRRVRD